MTAATAWLRRRFGPAVPGLGDWAESDRYDGRRAEFPLQPRNAVSNLSYALSGLLLLAVLRTPGAAVFAFWMTLLGLGSALYHGWPTADPRAGSWPLSTRDADHAPMYAAFAALLLTSVGASWPLLLAGSSAAALLARLDAPLEWGMAAALGGTLLLETLAPGALSGWGVLSLLLYVLSYGAWLLDRGRDLLGSWGHAAWHWGTGPATALMYLEALY